MYFRKSRLNGLFPCLKVFYISRKVFREQIGDIISGKVAVVIAYDIDGPQHLQMISNTSNASGSFVLQDLDYTDIINYV
jgi:hypothetical protein